MTSASSIKSKLQTLQNSLSPWHSSFPDQIDEISLLEKEFSSKLDRLSDEKLRLSIGIMGQVNAGKSSFLNALLFDGKPVLPEAATPKTANLTRITFGKTPKLTVYYYSPDEWQAIEKAAASPGDHAEARVGRDLLKMVSDNGIDVASVLATECEHVDADDVSGLMDKLNNYVGENGRLTALVKMTDIQLPLDELKGFDVVDTPGMNDPVPSRTQKTREYMARCDVVFFLSRCGQFLDQSDMNLLSGQLPGKGVKRMVLVAGQFDGAICDDGYDRRSLIETERNIKTRLGRRAEAEIENLAQHNENSGKEDIANLLRSIKTPIFASTYAHGYASWKKSQWGKGMLHMNDQLAGMAAEYWGGYRFSKEDWLRIANFDALRTAYHAARNDKQALLEAQREGLIPDVQRELKTRVERLIETVENRVEKLRKGDVKELDRAIKECNDRINGIATRLGEIIDKVRINIEKTSFALRSDLEAEIGSATQLKTRTGAKTEVSRYSVSQVEFIKPWTWFKDDAIVEQTHTTTYEYLATSDAIEKVVNYSHESAAALQRAFNDLVNLSVLRADLKRGLVEELNTASESFNPSEFRATLEGTLSRLRIPELQLKLDDQTSAISAKFSGKVKSEKKMDELRESVRAAVRAVFEQLLSSLKSGVNQLDSELVAIRDNLGKELAKDLRKEMELLEKAFHNKTAELETYREILEVAKSATVGDL